MRICFVTNSVITRHATMKRAFGLTPGLQARGCRVEICLEDHPDNRAEMEALGGCRAHYYRKGTFWQEYRQKAKVIANCGCDVVHICGLGWRNALLPRGNTPPIVMDHVELESSLEDVTFPRKQAQALLEWASLFAYRNTVMASNYLKSTFQTKARRFRLQRRMMVLPYASDVPATLGGMRGGAKSKLAIGGKRLILYMGRQYKNYGCLDIVEALDRLRAVRRDWHAVLLGDGPEHQRIGQRIEQLGLKDNIELPGYTTGLTHESYLAAADVFLLPLYDTVVDWARCPSKIYIYMMYARPIVTCRIGEAFAAVGSDGIYYESGDIDSMARAISSGLDVPQDWHPTYDSREHTWDARAEVYLRWLRSWVPDGSRTMRNVA
jgi:glycosyltransferase involved in cell wall biosynthesis